MEDEQEKCVDETRAAPPLDPFWLKQSAEERADRLRLGALEAAIRYSDGEPPKETVERAAAYLAFLTAGGNA